MDLMNSKIPIIIDFGTSSIKVGFSGQEKPSLVFPNIFGEMKYPKAGGLLKKDEKREVIGNDCLKYMGVIQLKYPSVHGMFKDTEDIDQILEYIYTNLDINMAEVKEHPVLVTEPLLSPRENRQKIAKVLFEKHKIE